MKKIIVLLLFLFSSDVWSSRIRTLRCNDKKEEGVISLLDYVRKNWPSIEAFWEQKDAIKYPNCLKRRFYRNGVVVCSKKNFVEPEYYRCIGSSGWANFGGIRANICSNFFEHMDKLAIHNKRACYAGLLFRLYGENCYKVNRFPNNYMTLVEFGFKWYSEHNPVTINFRDCKFQ